MDQDQPGQRGCGAKQKEISTFHQAGKILILSEIRFELFCLFSIREKQGKIDAGLERINKEKNLQYLKVGELRDLKRNFQINNLAKVVLRPSI